MVTLFRPLCSLLLLCLASSSLPAAQNAKKESPSMVTACNQFTFSFYQSLAAGEKGNLICSPFNAWTALAMADAGAQGETRAQFAKVLGIPTDSAKAEKEIGSLLKSLTDPAIKRGYEINAANRLYAQKGFRILPTYLTLTQSLFGAGLAEADFGKNPTGAAQEINGWVEKQTRNKIKNLVSPSSFNDMTRLVLVSALSLKAGWQDKFHKEETKNEDFFPEGKTPVKVPMMRKSATRAPYFDGGSFEAVTLAYKYEESIETTKPANMGRYESVDYGQNSLSMIVILPKKGVRLADVEKSLASRDMVAETKNNPPVLLNLSLPRFKTESSFMLNKSLQALGLTAPFNPEADFSGINGAGPGKPDALFISAALQKTYIETDEQGTEAAAATVMMLARSAFSPDRPKPLEFHCNRPFLYFIRDNATGLVLFVGRVTDF